MPIYPCIPAARDLGRYCSIWKTDWEVIFWCSFHVNIIHYGMGLWSDTSVNKASQAPISKTLLVPPKQAQETHQVGLWWNLFWTLVVSKGNWHLYSSPKQKLMKQGFTRHPLLLGRHWVILIMNLILAFQSAVMRRRKGRMRMLLLIMMNCYRLGASWSPCVKSVITSLGHYCESWNSQAVWLNGKRVLSVLKGFMGLLLSSLFPGFMEVSQWSLSGLHSWYLPLHRPKNKADNWLWVKLLQPKVKDKASWLLGSFSYQLEPNYHIN